MASLGHAVEAMPKSIDLPISTLTTRLCGQLKLGKRLGGGARSSVYSASRADQQLALKCIPLEAQEPDQQWSLAKIALQEVYALLCCDQLAKQGFPHFPRLHGIHLLDRQLESWRLQSELSWCIVMEKCEGNLKSWRAADCTAHSPVLIATQLFATFYALARCYHLCNNDAYARNILWTRVAPGTHLLYQLGHVQLLVPTEGYLWKLTDFGLATHRSKLDGSLTYSDGPIQHPSAVHVALLQQFPRYARDIAAFLADLAQMFPNSVWLTAVNHCLNQGLRTTRFSTASGLLGWIEYVTSELFLASTGVRADLLRANLLTCKQLAADGQLVVCDLNRCDTRAMRLVAQAQFHKLKEAALGRIYEQDPLAAPSSSTSDESPEA